MKLILSHLLVLISSLSFGQDTKGNFIQDRKNNCTVWFKNGFAEDSVSWSGGCKNGFASGQGTMIGYTNGKPTSRYAGQMANGKPDGKGIFTFAGNTLKLKGNFSGGEILNLRADCLQHLSKQIVFNTDSLSYYAGDNNASQLYYHAVIPAGKIKGAIVLLPGTWETTEHLISSNQRLCELAYDRNIAVIVPSVNQRLTMTKEVVNILNAMLSSAIRQYTIPADKFIIGGWSMGGLFSLRYAELANESAGNTVVKPVAVFSCDGPCDLENTYNNFQRKHTKFPNASEPAYGIKELEAYCGGNPTQAQKQYIYYSCYSHSQADGGNARFLKNTPVRIYDDVDPNWWMANRGVDMYDMNALDQTAMILLLKDNGNKDAAFINAYGRGYRLEGNRHPHSWSIVEPDDTMKWIAKYIN